MAKMSAINKNNRRIKLSDKFYNKNCQNYHEILQKLELWIDVKLQVDHMVFTEN